MPILVSHNSALERLRAVPPQVDTARLTEGPIDLNTVVPLKREIMGLSRDELGIAQLPIHHLMPGDKSTRQSKLAKSHRWQAREVPAGLVREIVPGCYTCGPELCFIQMAASMSLVGAVVLGYELCGSYSQFPSFISGFYKRPPLTSVKKIEAVLDSLEGVRGARRAREALRWVRDGSASPMETVIACMLYLPCSMGGFGLAAPELNCEVGLSDEEAAITGTKYCMIDAGYRVQKVGLEFDGEAYHRNVEKDRRRREALAHAGWRIYVLNTDEVVSYEWLRRKVALLDGVPRQRRGEEPSKTLANGLLARLLKATRFGVGLNRVLFNADVPAGMIEVHL